jgi:hypothetical protein
MYTNGIDIHVEAIDDIVDAAIDTLSRREGFRRWWDGLEPEIQDEINDELSAHLGQALEEWAEVMGR